MKSYAPYHQLFAISVIACEINKMNESVPSPAVVFQKLHDSGLTDEIITMSGNCLNMALDSAASEAADNGKMFVPQNWIKSKGCLKDLRSSIRQYLSAMKMMPGGMDIINKFNAGLAMKKEDFEVRWTAD